jgi:hypothetical protein
VTVRLELVLLQHAPPKVCQACRRSLPKCFEICQRQRRFFCISRRLLLLPLLLFRLLVMGHVLLLLLLLWQVGQVLLQWLLWLQILQQQLL